MSDGALFGHNVLKKCYLVTTMHDDDYYEFVFWQNAEQKKISQNPLYEMHITWRIFRSLQHELSVSCVVFAPKACWMRRRPNHWFQLKAINLFFEKHFSHQFDACNLNFLVSNYIFYSKAVNGLSRKPVIAVYCTKKQAPSYCISRRHFICHTYWNSFWVVPRLISHILRWRSMRSRA